MKNNDATEKNEVDLHLLAWKVFHNITVTGGGGGSNSQGNTYSTYPVVLVNKHVCIQSFTHSFIDSTNLS